MRQDLFLQPEEGHTTLAIQKRHVLAKYTWVRVHDVSSPSSHPLRGSIHTLGNASVRKFALLSHTARTYAGSIGQDRRQICSRRNISC